jgi:hypothetical protein
MAAITRITLPRRSRELDLRLVADVEDALDAELDTLRAELAERLAAGRHDIVRGEELAVALLEQAWGGLEPAVAAALDAVSDAYAELPARVAEVRAELGSDGVRSWIAEALCKRLAFDLAYDALGDIGALS